MIAVRPIEFPQTETVAQVRSLIRATPSIFDTSTADHPLVLAKQFVSTLVGQEISEDVAERAMVLLADLRQVLPGLDVPTLAPGPDGLLGMTWENARYHVNIEVLADGSVEYFGEDLISHALWSEDHTEPTLSDGLLAQLQQVR